MSQSRRLYRAFIELLPDTLVDDVERRLTPLAVRRGIAATNREAAAFASQVPVPSRWYATDGSNAFYFFRKKATAVSNADFAFKRLPVTCFGTNADQAFRLHGGQLTDRRPSGWISAATRSAAAFDTGDGDLADWGWSDNEDLDLSIAAAVRLRNQTPDYRPVIEPVHFTARVKAKAGIR